MKIKVKYTGTIYSYQGALGFTVDVIANCANAVITIDNTIFIAETSGFTMTQSIWQLTTTLTWTDAIVSVKDASGNIIDCGTLAYEFLNSDSTPFASTTPIFYDMTVKTLSMQTNDPAQVSSYSKKLKVSLPNWTTASAAIKAFKVSFINSCEPPISVVTSSVSTQTYNLSYAIALSFVIGSFNVTPAYCPINY